MIWLHAELVCNNLKASILTLPTVREWNYLAGKFNETTVVSSWLGMCYASIFLIKIRIHIMLLKHIILHIKQELT